jgi:2-polyprenyl-6-methoxyphenol hydroxylase-like FAD-dependent oxidoreductase
MTSASTAPSVVPATAVVIGAGIAGLCAARVLSDRFTQVVVLDRDELPNLATPRRGVPQGAHGHILLAAGQQAFGELFPGLVAELVAAGAIPFDPGSELSYHRYGVIWPLVSTGVGLLAFSRPLLETTLARRVRNLPNVRIRDRAAVSGLLGADGRVAGVRLADGAVVAAALVVDCTGRGSRSDRWLADLGHPAPRIVEVKAGIGYASRLLRRRPGDFGPQVGAFALPAPPHEKRAGLVLAVEDDRWLVSLGGWHGDFPGADEESFLAHARSLPHPAIAELLDRCEPLTDIATHHFPASRRRYFEEQPDAPAGYLALGDAICSFNPIYGQGMTCAALESIALGRLLAAHGAAGGALSREFYREVGRIITTPWGFAAGGDFAYPETVGPRPRGIGLLNRYSRRIQLAAQVDPEIRRTFTQVQHLLLPPGVLRRPPMVWKVLRTSRRAPGARV